MAYVMVPVRAGHVEDMMRFVLNLMSEAAVVPWDAAAIRDVLGEIDEPSRVLLSTVARAKLSGDRATETDIATAAELSWREVAGLVHELNVLARGSGRPYLVVQRTVEDALADGRTRTVRVLGMKDEVAALVRDADREHLPAAEHPREPDGEG